MKLKTKSVGFTLIELLVVIAVIGLLASVLLVALNSTRMNSRDTKRVSDMVQLQKAIQLYALSNNEAYPVVPGNTITSNSSQWQSVFGAELNSFISAAPIPPPSSQNPYTYIYTSSSFYCYQLGAKSLTLFPNSFVLIAPLENTGSKLLKNSTVTFGSNYIIGDGSYKLSNVSCP